MNRLWTKNYTIITIGSVVSMLGNSMAGFAMSLFVLDYTQSPLYYAIYMFLYTLPQIAAPVLAGPLMDRFSRRRTIYMLDFASTAIYALLAGLMHFGLFNFWAFASITFIIGTIHSAYTVAFESFYPMLVSEGNYIKAYSVLSTLETLVLVMIPVSTFLYKTVGMVWLMLINSACFCTAAIFETQISDVEGKNGQSGSKYTFGGYMEDMKEGMRYLWTEKGLLYITLYFIFCFMATGASNVITLPYFKAGYADGEYIYMSVWGFMVLGRVLGGMMHYRLHLPEEHKFKIAVFVYVVISALEGTYLYLPLALMRLFCFLQGVLGVTSYNIRISSTQSYVPDDRKGRFNGTFLMLTTVGSLLGQLLAGMLTEIMPMRGVLSLFMGISGASAVIIMGKGRNAVKPIYNKKQ